MPDANAKSRLLRELVRAPRILVMPGVHDALSAKVFEAAGFRAVQCSSWGIAAAAGLPEGGVHSWADHREAIRKIVQAVDIPANADIEDGYGGPRQVRQVVRELIQIGAAGTNLEDRAWRASPHEPIRLIPLEAMLEKLNAVVETRRQQGSEFFLNARTDALTVTGADPAEALEEAIRRGNAFARAGADLVFVWGAPTAEQIRALTSRIQAPVAISGHGIALTVQELQALGVARVSYGSASANVAAGAVHRLARAILDQGSPAPVDDLAHAVDLRRLIWGV